MQSGKLNASLMDTGFYLAYDGLKKRGIPDTKMIVEDAVVPLGYHLLAEDQIKSLDFLFPGEARPFGDMLLKFGGQLALTYLWRWGMKSGSMELGPILIKVLVAQGAQEIYKKI